MPLGTSVYFTMPLLVVSALATVGPMRKTRASASDCCAPASLKVIWMIPVSLELCALAGEIVPIIPKSNARTSANADQRLGTLLISCEILALASVLSLRTRPRPLCSHRVLSDCLQEPRPEIGELLLAHPADRAELGRGARDLARHRAQHGVAEDDIRRDVPLGRDLAPQRAQRRGQIAGVLFVGGGGVGRPAPPAVDGGNGLTDHDRRAVDERPAPGLRQRDDVVAGGVLHDQAPPPQRVGAVAPNAAGAGPGPSRTS